MQRQILIFLVGLAAFFVLAAVVFVRATTHYHPAVYVTNSSTKPISARVLGHPMPEGSVVIQPGVRALVALLNESAEGKLAVYSDPETGKEIGRETIRISGPEHAELVFNGP